MARTNTGTNGNYFLSNIFAGFPLEPFTLAAWANIPTGGSGRLIVLQSHATTNNRYFIDIENAGGLYANAFVSSGPTSAYSSVGALSVNKWQHVCGVFQSTTLRKIYTNGLLVGGHSTDTTSAGFSNTDFEMFAGGDYKGGGYYDGPSLNGSMADLAIWTTALSNYEVCLLNSGVCPLLVRPEKLWSYHPLRGLNYPDEPDMLGGHPLTMFGTMGVELTHSTLDPYINNRQIWIPAPKPTSGAFTASAIASTSFVGNANALGVVLAVGSSTFSAVAGGISFAASASASTSLVGSSLWAASFAANGLSTVTPAVATPFTALATATTSFDGQSTWQASFAANGSSTCVPVVDTPFAATGSSAASFVGSSEWAASFTATGLSTATFPGQLPSFSASGSASSNWGPDGVAFKADGLASTNWIGAFSIVGSGIFSAIGDSTAGFVGTSTWIGSFSADGSASTVFLSSAFFHADGAATASFYSLGGSSVTATFTAVAGSEAILYPIAAYQAQGTSSAAWGGVAGTVQEGDFSSSGTSTTSFRPAASFTASGSSTAVIYSIADFKANGSSALSAVGESTWESAFSGAGDSEASFIRFVPKVTPNPARITPGTSATLTLYGQGTQWTQGAPLLSAPGLTFSHLTVVSDTEVTVTATASTTPQTTLITDSTSGATTTLLIKRKTNWIPPRRA